MLQIFKSSGEANLKVMRKPEVTVKSLGDFKEGGLTIAPLSRNVTFIAKKGREDPEGPGGSVKVGKLIETRSADAKGNVELFAFIKKDLVFPDVISKADCARVVSTPHVVAYWAVKQTHDQSKINCEKVIKNVTVKVLKATYDVPITVIKNIKVIHAGDELWVAKNIDEQDEDDNEPAAKRPRFCGKGGRGNGKGRGKKGTGRKGKGK